MPHAPCLKAWHLIIADTWKATGTSNLSKKLSSFPTVPEVDNTKPRNYNGAIINFSNERI